MSYINRISTSQKKNEEEFISQYMLNEFTFRIKDRYVRVNGLTLYDENNEPYIISGYNSPNNNNNSPRTLTITNKNNTREYRADLKTNGYGDYRDGYYWRICQAENSNEAAITPATCAYVGYSSGKSITLSCFEPIPITNISIFTNVHAQYPSYNTIYLDSVINNKANTKTILITTTFQRYYLL